MLQANRQLSISALSLMPTLELIQSLFNSRWGEGEKWFSGDKTFFFFFQSGGAAGGGAGGGAGSGSEVTPGHVKLVKRGNKMEVLL